MPCNNCSKLWSEKHLWLQLVAFCGVKLALLWTKQKKRSRVIQRSCDCYLLQSPQSGIGLCQLWRAMCKQTSVAALLGCDKSQSDVIIIILMILAPPTNCHT